ncbi:MAG: HAD-IIB family hydrolase [Clostridia bacterium]|nr:HAD-IIB family hydrolase [Clostridia bacterium]
MKLFEGWLIAADVDGTLMTNGVIPQRNIEKIEWFLSEGGFFSLSTGRTPGAVGDIREKIKNISPSIMGNGAMIYDFEKDELVYNRCLPQEDKIVIKTIYDECSDLGMEIHSGVNVLVPRRSEETDIHESYESLEVSNPSMEKAMEYPWTKVLVALKDENDALRVKEIVSRFELKSRFLNTTARIDGKDYHYLEQVCEGTSKASALKELCKILNIKNGRCCAIGDYYNDFEMLLSADISASPLDAPDDIKEKVNFICSKAEYGAVADFIDYIQEAIRKETKNGR